MARPRKMSTEDMIAIVDAVYDEHGDPAKLKCSSLAEYAMRQGFEVKAYDFRRNTSVRERIDELSDLSLFFTQGGILAYKGLDVEAFIRRNKRPESLKIALIELDGTWKKIHDRANVIMKERESLSAELNIKMLESEALARDYNELSSQTAQIKAINKEMLAKNRYLTAMIKQYLYPEITNEILKNEGVLESVDTEVAQGAMDALTEPNAPLSFSQSTATDKELTREELLLSRMTEI